MTNKKDESYDDPIVATAIALLGALAWWALVLN